MNSESQQDVATVTALTGGRSPRWAEFSESEWYPADDGTAWRCHHTKTATVGTVSVYLLREDRMDTSGAVVPGRVHVRVDTDAAAELSAMEAAELADALADAAARARHIEG